MKTPTFYLVHQYDYWHGIKVRIGTEAYTTLEAYVFRCKRYSKDTKKLEWWYYIGFLKSVVDADKGRIYDGLCSALSWPMFSYEHEYTKYVLWSMYWFEKDTVFPTPGYQRVWSDMRKSIEQAFTEEPVSKGGVL